MANNAAAPAAAVPYKIELILSRPRYRSGSSVVGTVLISSSNPAHRSSVADLKKSIHSAKLYLSGHTRIDPRWHDAESLSALYGSHPHLSERFLPKGVEERAVRSIFGDCRDGVHVEGGRTVCFYASNVVDLIGENSQLIDRPERREVKCGAIRMSADDKAEDTANDEDDGEQSQRPKPPKQQMLAFTFRSKLPDDAPPSAMTLSARYFYSAVLCVETSPYEGDTIVVQTPFSVVQSRHGNKSAGMLGEGGTSSGVTVQSGGRVKLSTLHAVSHPNGLPCYISPTDLSQPAKLSVDRDYGLCSRASCADVKSLRVTDETGCPCCVVTLIGTTALRPGGRAEIRCDFDEEVVLHGDSMQDDEEVSTTRLLPCYRVSAFLQGEEVALNQDGTSRRTRSYAFDTAHADVEPGCTDSVSLGVCLPLDCPISLHTDLVKVTTICKVVLTVKKDAGVGVAATPGTKYDELTLEIPCEVSQDTADDEEEEVMMHDKTGNSADHLLGYGWQKPDEGEELSWRGNFVADDIMNDLRMLSLYVARAASAS